ncbi:aspartate aminotransferase family protein [Arthrobacter sp. E3]|uniref:aspartate aminotransferase family protein n=1 Tax=Arthrobacter sp. E3 TaxID=517402 RepID=UPI001A93B76F|nr:aspartate aminotransferase family protein [Arthrobacter sp. E3]
MSSPSLYCHDEQAIAGVEKLRFFPLAVESGRGCVLVEPGGRELLDFSASWTASGMGHGHPDIVSAVSKAIATAPGASILSMTHPDGVALAEQLLALVPSRPSLDGPRRVYLGHAGSDANDVALRGCRHATGRSGVIAFQGGYHGGLGIAQGVSGIHVDSGSPADPHVTFAPYPASYQPHTGDAATVVPETLRRVRLALAARTIAAVIVEPLQSDGGLLVPPPGFLEGLRQLCDEYGSYLIFDEVKVGLGRTGFLHAFEHDGVVPDIITLGKALGGGRPLSAAIGPAAVLDHPTASALMTTVGNPVSCAAGRAVLELLEEGEPVRNAAERGKQLSGLLHAYACAPVRPGSAHVGDVRGRGLSIGVEIVKSRDGKMPDDKLTAKTAFRAWELGLVAYPVRGNVLELTPPLTVSELEIERGVELLTRAIDDAALGVVSDAAIEPYSGW